MNSLMARETREAPACCADQIEQNREIVSVAGRRLRALAPPFVATLARGSSDQAAAFAKVVLETHADMPALSHAPSIGSLYKATSSRFNGVPLIAISQSGRSPDLIAAAQGAQQKGALVIAIVNDAASPLAEIADIVIPIHAGPEKSVAATKSLICSLVALTHLVAEWREDARLLLALKQVGSVLERAVQTDWTEAASMLRDARSMFVLGRGLTLPIAGEAALKLKETCNLHAEAFSAAEVAHGPMTLVGADDPVFVFGPVDAAREGLQARIENFANRGAKVIATGIAQDVAAAALALPSPFEPGCHPVLAAIAQIQSFYGLANALSLTRGLNPDQPPHLAKVTNTL